MTDEMKLDIPLDVPQEMKQIYAQNLNLITNGTGRLILFAGDQKIEHLNSDYVGEGISSEDADPRHLFEIAAHTGVGCFASQLELIARYGAEYKDVPYVIKLNSRTNIIKDDEEDPLSLALVTMDQVKRFKEDSGLNIIGIGYTVYIGSEHEAQMLAEAGKAIFEAHQMGMLAILWVYPRGKYVENKLDPKLIAGAAGVGASLGADFVKVNYPEVLEKEKNDPDYSRARAEAFREAVVAAGKTKVICSGGDQMDAEEFIRQLWEQIHISGAAGSAVGRNLHQRSLEEAKSLVAAMRAVIFEDASAEDAVKLL